MPSMFLSQFACLSRDCLVRGGGEGEAYKEETEREEAHKVRRNERKKGPGKKIVCPKTTDGRTDKIPALDRGWAEKEGPSEGNI